MEHYAAAQGDRVKMDELIREQMCANNGDYSPILNVLAALKQEDPELYDMCLNYPNKQHTPITKILRYVINIAKKFECYFDNLNFIATIISAQTRA
jgi:hypothetical protein